MMPPKFQLVIFDCDGVLVDTEPASQQIMAELATLWGRPCAPDEAKRLFMGHSMPRCLEILRVDLGLTVPDDFLAIYDAKMVAFLRAGVQPVPGVERVLQNLTLPKCVASNGRLGKMQISLTATGLLKHFGANVFSAEQVARPKPAPDLFLFAAEKMGVAPAHCLVVEDSPLGTQGAITAGMRVWGFAPDPHDAMALKKAGAEFVFFSMHAIEKKFSEIVAS